MSKVSFDEKSSKTMKELTPSDLDAQIKENKKIYEEHFDKELLKVVNSEVVDLLDECYFRPEFIGFDDFPQRNNPDRPLILVSNHSGMAFPWDGMIFASRWFKKQNYGRDAVRPIVAPALSQTVLMNPFMISHIWKKVGAVDATTLNFETMMHQNDFNVMMYPEGVPGIGKGFNNRYKLQRFSTSFVRMSLKYQTDVIPFYTINGEYINPYSYRSKFLNKIVNVVGIPFLPIALHTLLILIQPWFFYYALPAKLTYVMGKRIRPSDMIDKPFEEITQAEITQIRDRIHAQMQAEITKASEDYGKKPYHFGEFFKRNQKNLGKFPFTFPFGWPLLFAEFERLFIKKRKLNEKLKLGFLSTLKIILRNPITIAYFIPILGWVPLLIKGYGKQK